MMKRERWGNFAACNTFEYFSELLKITQFWCIGGAHYANVECIFSLIQPQT